MMKYTGGLLVVTWSRQPPAKPEYRKTNHRIRRILHFPTINVVRFQGGIFADLFERTYQRHHIKMKSYVAVQKKLLIILYTLRKNDQPFIEQRVIEGKK